MVARATARTELEVWAGPPSTLPANTDITGGATITSSFGSGGTSATATRTFSLARTSRSMLDESGNAATTGAPAFPAAGVGPRFGPPTHHEIEVELASATPTVVRLMVATCNEPVGGTYDGTLSVPGHGDLQNVLPTPCGAPAVRTLDLALGPTPTALVFRTRGPCQTGHGLLSARFHARWQVTVEHRSPCAGLAYDAPCGATLTSYGTVDLPGTWLELEDPAQPAAAFLLVAAQRVRVPFAGCFVLTVSRPPAVPAHRARPRRRGPDSAAVSIRAHDQGVTLGAAGLHMSNGLELRCN